MAKRYTNEYEKAIINISKVIIPIRYLFIITTFCLTYIYTLITNKNDEPIQYFYTIHFTLHIFTYIVLLCIYITNKSKKIESNLIYQTLISGIWIMAVYQIKMEQYVITKENHIFMNIYSIDYQTFAKVDLICTTYMVIGAIITYILCILK